KDIFEDSIPGISLEKAQRELLNNRKATHTVIAIIDSPIDKDHEYVKDYIWVNKGEIPNNNIDDDANGYVDDIHGWNFQGNSQGENISFMHMEYTRIIRKFDSLFKNKSSEEIEENEKDTYESYQKAKEYYSDRLAKSKQAEQYYTMIYKAYYKAKDQLSPYLKNDFSKSKLDSLKNMHSEDKPLQDAIFNYNTFSQFTSEEVIDISYIIYSNHIKVLLNTEYDEREKKRDNPNDLSDRFYGNNNVSHSLDILTHGTNVVAPMINYDSKNDTIRGISSSNRIMPISISGYGDEHDKDIALAIRYAVDNGAKVINLSFGKRLSLHKEWVFDALKYADEHDVLIVSSAGNNSMDLDVVNDYYPNDNVNNGQEVSRNFLLIGSSSFSVNDSLVCNFSNYGKKDVDIFAPGEKIATLLPFNIYTYERGTSMSASITSGIAALIFSYYPNLTAAEVKQIIMESGVSFDIMVKKPSASNEKELVPFSSLSKSGKIVNAYNALLLAEEVSKKKKRKKRTN
ncbi:S8 family serine peptidase, partial [Kordia zhangzhouensis]|uniref:S8 family serine peptidase n=1 Tax=Kordia zhangzhouensis TaxID=1620405 RepID=UPI0006296DC0